MTSQQSLERLVEGWMADEAPASGDAEVIDRIVATTSRRRPLPRWLAMLRESPMSANARFVVGSPTRRMAFAVALLVLALAAALGVAGAFLLQRQSPPDAWSGFRGGPGHDGLGGIGPTGNPVVRWTVRLGAPVMNNVAIAGELALVPSEDGMLHALRLADGSEAWRYNAGTSLTGPAGSDGRVYVTDGRGILHALDLATGAVLWSADRPFASASPAMISNGTVFVGTSDGHVVAFDASSGALRWDATVSSTGEVVGSPAAGAGLIFAASANGGLVALRESTGDEVWRFDTRGDPLGTVVYADGVVYVGSPAEFATGGLRAVEAATGQLRWIVNEPLFSPSVVGPVAISSSDVGVISARDVTTGTEQWRLKTGGVSRAAAIAGGIAFVAADADREVLAIEMSTGRVDWRLRVDGSIQCCLAVADGLVFAGTMNGTVYAIGGDGLPVSPQVTASGATQSLAPSAGASPSAPPSASSSASPLADPIAITRRIEPTDLGLDRILGLVISPSRDIYVSDLSDHVTRLDPTGKVIRSWGGPGAEPGQFDFSPASTSENVHGSIGVGPDGSVYVSDSDNHRVQVFTPNGDFVREFGSIGTAPDQFSLAFDLTADARGNVYVLDDGALNLRKFSSTGRPIWAADGSTDAVLAGHGHGATLDPLGRIVLVNDDQGKVAYVDPDGAVVDSFDAKGCDAAVDAKGNVFVSDCSAQVTQVFDAEHRLIGSGQAGIALLRFGPGEQVVGLSGDGAILFLTVALPQ